MTDAEWAIVQPMAIRRGTAEIALDAAKQAAVSAARPPIVLRTLVEANIAVQRAREELDTSTAMLKAKIQTLFKLQQT